MNNVRVTASDRLDKVLAKHTDFSRAMIQKMIAGGLVTVNDEVEKASYIVEVGDVIEYDTLEAVPMTIEPVKMALDIVYEDEHLAVINKPSGLVVHPGAGHNDVTLVHGLLAALSGLSGIGGVMRPGIVHRIDKDTSGLLVVAKTDDVHLALTEHLKRHEIKREYLVIVHGVIDHDRGKIDAPIGRSKHNRLLMDVVPDGKPSVTHFEVIERFAEHTLVRCTLETGRTHQIRVHFKYIGYPVVGDPQYGLKKQASDTGQALHATSLSFVHPVTHQAMHFTAAPPKEFDIQLEKIQSR
jgi:23S rRNA pseudouridine1911/1915/1917 synthase